MLKFNSFSIHCHLCCCYLLLNFCGLSTILLFRGSSCFILILPCIRDTNIIHLYPRFVLLIVCNKSDIIFWVYLSHVPPLLFYIIFCLVFTEFILEYLCLFCVLILLCFEFSVMIFSVMVSVRFYLFRFVFFWCFL